MTCDSPGLTLSPSRTGRKPLLRSAALGLVLSRNRKLIFNLLDLHWRVPSEEPLHVGCKFTQEVVKCIRAEGTTITTHRVTESPVMSRVVGVLQRAGEQSSKKLRSVESIAPNIISHDYNSCCRIPRSGNEAFLVRRKIPRILMQQRRQGK